MSVHVYRLITSPPLTDLVFSGLRQPRNTQKLQRHCLTCTMLVQLPKETTNAKGRGPCTRWPPSSLPSRMLTEPSREVGSTMTTTISTYLSANIPHKYKHKREHQPTNDERPTKGWMTPHDCSPHNAAWQCHLTPALPLRGFSVSLGSVPVHRLHTPRFCKNPYPYPLKPIPLGMGTGFPGYGCG
jgi:hypothetical protein